MKRILRQFKLLLFAFGRIYALAVIGSVLGFNGALYAQPVTSNEVSLKITTEKVTIGLQDESMETAIKKIEQHSAFRFFYRDEDIRPLSHLNLTKDTRTIAQTLDILLQNTGLSFRQIDNNILLERKPQQALFDIRGRVIDTINKKPVVNASVFLSKTTVGDKTANNGTFDLHDVKPGSYMLVVSIVGFKTHMQPVSVVNGSIVLRDISITPQTIALKEVTIAPMPADKRDMYLDWFEEEFLGASAFAQECKILNPEIIDLDFDDTTKTLTASSPDFLEIENDALGYKVKYKLAGFSLKNRGEASQKIHYEGTCLFEEMKGTPSQQERWQKHRLEAYENSPVHFLRSALNDKLEQQGFWALRYAKYPNPLRPADSLIEAKIDYFKKMKSERPDARDSLSWWVRKSRLPKIIDTLMPDLLHKADIIRPTDQPGLFALALTRSNYSLLISYNKKHMVKFPDVDHPPRIRIYAVRDLANPENSENTLVTFDKPYALFDKNGVLVSLNDLAYSGIWARERIAELLPDDYQPPTDINGRSTGAKLVDASSSAPPALKEGLLNLQTASDSLARSHPVEKLYMQFDKPYYAIGDTIWFKAYLLNDYLAASAKSRIINIDIANDSSKVIKQFKLPAEDGLTWGNISLDEKDGFAPGTYTIRAYTNWMRNFGDGYFFYKRFYVAGMNENSWLINKQVKETLVNGANTADVKLRFSSTNKMPFAAEPLQLTVMEGNKTLYRQKVQTDGGGLIDVNFSVPQKSSSLVIVAENEKKNKRAVIPIPLNRAENTDVQFLPEGGKLVAGLRAHIGFKAIGEEGKGVQVAGIITDHNGGQVAQFQALHNGMGSFDMTPKAGESYTAEVTLPGGIKKAYNLPAIENSGTVLTIKNPAESDYLEVSIGATNDVMQAGGSYYLIGKARGVVCYAAIINLNNGHDVASKIAKNLFPSGIAHFTVMTAKYQPLNERMVFINHHDNLNIRIDPDKSNYNSRDSVGLNIKVTGDEGNPVSGDFSLAVTDDAQVKTDTLNGENIISRMLLASDLKGYVEAPGYYLSSKKSVVREALDDLLLTQGWIGYDWGQVFNPPVLSYPAEQELTVKGNVVNVFNKPVKGTDILLFSKIPAILMDTLTDKEGKFEFDRFPRVDTPVFVLKAVNKHGKSFNVQINVDEVKPPGFVKPVASIMAPWYVNSDTTLLNYAKNNAFLMQQDYLPAGGHRLKEVKITGRKIIKDSQNLNGSGNADIVLDEKDMEKAGKKNWLQLMQENIKGLRVVYRTGASGWYYIDFRVVRIIIDGIELTPDILTQLAPKNPDQLTKLNYFLELHSAEEIKGMEVSYSHKYTDRYGLVFHSGPATVYAFIEITTRSGQGPFLYNTPGMYLYKSLPISWPKQFYKPKYTVKDTANHIADLRSTIDWEPNVVTGPDGEAKVSFFTADKPSTYTVIIEGTDMNGNFGYKMGKITIGVAKNGYPNR